MFISQEQLNKLVESLKLLEDEGPTESIHVKAFDSEADLFTTEKTTMKVVMRTLDHIYENQPIYNMNGKQMKFEEIGDKVCFVDGKMIDEDYKVGEEIRKAKAENRELGIDITSEKYETMKVMESFMSPQSVETKTNDEVKLPKLEESLKKFENQNHISQKFISNLKTFLSNYIEKGKESETNQFDSILTLELLPHEKEFWEATKTLIFDNIPKPDPQLHRPRYANILEYLKKELKKYENFEDDGILNISLQSELIYKDFGHNITSAQILSKFNDLKRFSLYFQTEKYLFFVYSTREKKINSDKEGEKKVGHGFFMVFSLDENVGNYKMFESEKNCEIIKLVSNEIEISDLVKISFEKGMYLTAMNSVRREKDVKEFLNFCSEKLNMKEIKMLECCSLEMSEDKNKNKNMIDQLCFYEEIHVNSFGQKSRFTKLFEEYSAKRNRAKEFLKLLKEMILNKDTNGEKLEKMMGKLLADEKELLDIVLKVMEGKKWKKSEY